MAKPGTRFFRRIIAEVPDPRLGDDEAKELAEGLVCDYVWCLRKIARGELRTTQRTLIQEIAETNLKLLHELKRRRGEKTFTKARRIELTSRGAELEGVTVEIRLEASSLRAALEKSAATCRDLIHALVGDGWQWPEVS